MSDIRFRRARPADAPAIRDLYRAAAEGGTLARMPDEVDDAYVAEFMHAAQNGLELVAEASGKVVGDLHATRLFPRQFVRTLGDLTIAVHPAHQGQGIGKQLFVEFMRIVREEMPDIERVELFAWDENKSALKLYESVGFKFEGLLPHRVRTDSGEWRNDILYGWVR